MHEDEFALAIGIAAAAAFLLVTGKKKGSTFTDLPLFLTEADFKIGATNLSPGAVNAVWFFPKDPDAIDFEEWAQDYGAGSTAATTKKRYDPTTAAQTLGMLEDLQGQWVLTSTADNQSRTRTMWT